MAAIGGSVAAGGGGGAAAGSSGGDEHKLLDAWHVWEGHEQDKKYEFQWNDSRICIYEFGTVEDFWRKWNLQPRLSEVFIFPEGQCKVKRKDQKKPEMRTYAIESYQVFRKKIQPFTEWPNKPNRATKFVYRSSTEMHSEDMHKWDDLWRALVLLAIGESLPKSDKLNGVCITDKSAKASNFKINLDVWFSVEAGETVRALNEKLGDVTDSLGMRFSPFSLHKDYTKQ